MSIVTNPDQETTINDRVQQLIDHYKLNKSSFSKAIGLSNNMTVTNIVSGRKSKPGYHVLRKITDAFPVNPSWLLMGKGPMLLAAVEHNEECEVDTIVNAILQAPETFEKHPVFAKYLESKCTHAIIAYYENLVLNKPQLLEVFFKMEPGGTGQH